MATISGFITGMMGYSLKKEMLGDVLFYRELQTFQYEIYATDIKGCSPATIQQNIYNEFKSKYSGDINVKVFNQPADYSFPNDSIRAAKFNVEVQVKSVPNVGTWQAELGSNYYSGLDSGFLKHSGFPLLDFKEGFDFNVNDNGVQTFGHDISFGLLTGNKSIATRTASGIFSKDKDTTFGISAMVGLVGTIADPSLYQNYYTETYDTIRNTYSFSRKREILSSGASTYVYNLLHVVDVKNDGLIDVTERGNVKGKLTFAQAQQGADTLIGTAYSRCNGIYTTYSSLANVFSAPIVSQLVNTPIKTSRALNKPAISNDYEITYSNNPQLSTDGVLTEETFDINDIEIGVIDIKHTLSFTRNKRTSTTSFDTLIQNAITDSPGIVNTYFLNYNPAAWPIHYIKKEVVWPNKKNKGARVMMQYNNHPKYLVIIGGTTYKSLEYKIANTKPVDIITEYKVINRPSKTSVVNYSYQTEKGQLSITIDAGIGRNPDEFISGFRTDIGGHIYNLYQYATTLFFNEFRGIIPIAFTYYLNDVKYTYSSENGTLQLTIIFVYSLKKYTPA